MLVGQAFGQALKSRIPLLQQWSVPVNAIRQGGFTRSIRENARVFPMKKQNRGAAEFKVQPFSKRIRIEGRPPDPRMDLFQIRVATNTDHGVITMPHSRTSPDPGESKDILFSSPPGYWKIQ